MASAPPSPTPTKKGIQGFELFGKRFQGSLGAVQQNNIRVPRRKTTGPKAPNIPPSGRCLVKLIQTTTSSYYNVSDDNIDVIDYSSYSCQLRVDVDNT